MHREIQIKHGLMIHKCQYTLIAQDTKQTACVRKGTVLEYKNLLIKLNLEITAETKTPTSWLPLR